MHNPDHEVKEYDEAESRDVKTGYRSDGAAESNEAVGIVEEDSGESEEVDEESEETEEEIYQLV
ncbi:hypothetical protein NW762_006373 [Fusarium torreyae]|uniref:Uncharacterized protein n=1 Tax=Fusarium torreyae TaxID=1237075 RepID=A0A9W8VHX8_9HYPO|nr:hypothetical protein NW762_006373 [Fusarium torreyae]